MLPVIAIAMLRSMVMVIWLFLPLLLDLLGAGMLVGLYLLQPLDHQTNIIGVVAGMTIFAIGSAVSFHREK